MKNLFLYFMGVILTVFVVNNGFASCPYLKAGDNMDSCADLNREQCDIHVVKVIRPLDGSTAWTDCRWQSHYKYCESDFTNGCCYDDHGNKTSC